MSQGFIVGKGGGQSKGPIKKGTIVVTYPEGSVCTVTNGSGKTYTALDTSGAAAFIVEQGTWNVTAVQGTDSDTKSVTVTAGGWVEVELSFWNGELFESGLVVYNGKTIKWGQNPNLSIYNYRNTGTVTVGDVISCNAPLQKAAIATLEETFDLTGWNTLSVNFPTSSSTDQSIIVHSEPSGNFQDTIGLLAFVTAKGAGVTTLDISGVNQTAYISIGVNNNRNFTVDSVKLS